MKVMNAEFRGRLEHWMRTLKDDFYEPLSAIDLEMFATNEQLSFEDAAKAQYTKVEPGDTWGHTYEYGWMRGSIALDERAKGKSIVMDLLPGGEAAVFVNGKCFGTKRAEWVRERHHYMVDNFLTLNAEGNEKYEIYMEVYAGHYYPEFDGCATGPVLPGSYTDPKTEGSRITVGNSTVGIWNEDAYQLYMDADTLRQLLPTLDETSLRAAKIADALEKFTLAVDFEQDREGRIADYKKAREILKPVLEAENGSTMPVFYSVGNSHLDLAWLWPMHETFRKTERTFAQQLRLLERYPDYKYIQSQPASYEMCRKYYPELFERIKKAIKDGRWIADGAMWVEPDTNMSSGEALIRQVMYGKRYYKEELGVDSEVLWLPDTFGYSAVLPQILNGCGVHYLVTQKIFWSYNEGEVFPYHYFNWEGMDGSQITSFLPTSYTYRTDPNELQGVWKNRSQARDLEGFLIPFGYGDGGGGPTRDHIEYALREKNLEGMPKVEMVSPREFFTKMEENEGAPKNTYKGELYFACHRGTYTSQAMVKKNNRRNELMMRELEMWGVKAAMAGEKFKYDEAAELWKTLLLHQFHDILPGSSIAKVYIDAENNFKKLQKEAGEIIDAELSSICGKGDGVTVFNSLSFARNAVVTLPDSFKNGAINSDGSFVATEQTKDGVRAIVSLPALGAATFTPAAGGAKNEFDAKAYAEGDGFVLENSKVIVKVNKAGEITSYVMKASGRQFAAGNMNVFHVYKDVPRVFDAWDIDSNYIEQEVDGAFDVKVEVLTSGIEAALYVTGKISESTFTQKISLASGADRVEFDTKVDWKELHRLLKVAFPANVYTLNGINEIQFGYLERPTHRSRAYEKDRFEVCNHRYSALCDGSHGVAVLNDCKYGISMNDNSLELSLLKSAASPEMRADNREHSFKYAFMAWEGDFMNSNVVREGYDFNVPATVREGMAEEFSLASVDAENIFIDTIKPAEDRSGDVIMRLYDAKRAATKCTVTWNAPVKKVCLCDMLENVIEEVPVVDGSFELDFRTFEIKTVRLSL